MRRSRCATPLPNTYSLTPTIKHPHSDTRTQTSITNIHARQLPRLNIHTSAFTAPHSLPSFHTSTSTSQYPSSHPYFSRWVLTSTSRQPSSDIQTHDADSPPPTRQNPFVDFHASTSTPLPRHPHPYPDTPCLDSIPAATLTS